jgi:hypothetical protein
LGEGLFAAQSQAHLINQGKVLIDLGQEIIFQRVDRHAFISRNPKKDMTDEWKVAADNFE